MQRVISFTQNKGLNTEPEFKLNPVSQINRFIKANPNHKICCISTCLNGIIAVFNIEDDYDESNMEAFDYERYKKELNELDNSFIHSVLHQ